MAIEISLKKGTANPTSGLTLAEPLFNSTNNTLWMGKGSGNTPVWLGAGICGASGGIAAGLTYQIPTLGAVKDYISSIGTIGATGATGATGVQGATGAQGEPGQSSNYYNYKVHTPTQTPPTTNGEIRYNNATQTSSTTLYVDHLNSNGDDIDIFLSLLKQNDTLIIQDANDSNNYQTWKITSAPTVILNDYTTIPVTGITSAGTGTSGFSNNHSVLFIVFSSPIATAYVESLRGLTGAIGLTNGNGIDLSVSGNTLTVSNSGVLSFNGLTGAVTGVTVGGANTFTALNSFNAGISSAGGTFSSLARFTAGLTASSVYGGTVYTNNIVAQDVGSPVYINDSGAEQITYIGDYSGAGNSTLLTVNDSLNTITLGGSVVNTGGLARNYTVDGDTRTQTSSTTANQVICSLGVGSVIVDSTTVFAVEVTIMASDTTVVNKHEIVRMLVTHDFTNTFNTQYGVTRTGTALATYTTTITGATGKTLRIRATPTSANLTSFVVMYRTYYR